MKSKNTYLKTGILLSPFLWPTNRKDFKAKGSYFYNLHDFGQRSRVFYTPLILGKSVDSLNDLSDGINLLISIPIALIISYGITRVAFFFIWRNA